MAAILQLRRGAITDFKDYGSNLSEPYFDTDRDTIHIGTTNGTGSDADWITLVKLSQANRDFTKSEPNTGSLWIVGDITASDNSQVNLGVYDAINNPNGYDPNSGVLPSSIHSTSSMYLNGNLTASHAWFRRDVRIDGHLILGDSSNPSTYDVVNVQADFSGSLIPDNDFYGSQTAASTQSFHDLGTHNKRWRNLYLGLGVDEFISASNADFSGSVHISGTLDVDSQTTLASLNVEDLTNNRIVIAGINGEIEDDENFTFDGDELNIGLDNFTVEVTSGDIHTSGTLDVDGQATLASANIEDLAEDGIVHIGSSQGELITDANFTFDGTNFRLIGDYYQSGSGASFQFVGAGGEITGSWTISELAIDNGIVFTNAEGTLDNSNDFTWDGGLFKVDGNISGSGTLEIDGQSTLASLKVEDLTENRIIIAGVDGEVEDDQYFRYTNEGLIIGADEHFKVQVASGNTFISGAVQMYSTLNVDDQSTLASLNVEDLTDNRVVIVGAGGEIEDSGNFTFNGTELNIGTGNFTVQQGSGNTQILGTLDVDSQSTLSSLNVQDLTSGRVVLAGTSGEIEDSGNLTFDGSTLTVTGNTIVTGNLTIEGTQTQLNTSTLNVEDINILIASGALNATAADGAGITIDGADATIIYGSSDDSITINKQLKINGNISGSSFGGTTLLSSSNENFADYSQSVDTRLDYIEGPISTSLDSRLIEIFATGSDHETRIDEIETTFSSSVDSRISSNHSDIISSFMIHETRLSSLQVFSASAEDNDTELFATASDHETRLVAQELFSTSLDDTFATEAEVNSATSSLSSSLAIDIASNLSEITNLNSFSSSIESHLPDGVVSGSDQLTSSLDSRYIQSESITGSNVVGSDSVTSIETITSASYAAITPVSGTLYIIVD
jgi:hypothetical protein